MSEKLWRQFSRGDKAVFLRSMLGNGEARKIQDEIKARYVSDGEFRTCADRYLDKFEELLNQAERSDPANLLSSAFVTSDVGKVYVLLSRAVGRPVGGRDRAVGEHAPRQDQLSDLHGGRAGYGAFTFVRK